MAKTKAHTRYRLADKTIVPGVTTIISSSLGWDKNVLIAWARKTALAGEDPTKQRDAAAEIGTLTHLLIESHIRGAKPVYDDYSKNDIDKAETGFLAFLDWEKKNNPVYKETELQLISENYRVGGTVDAIVEIGDKLIMVDHKTSSGIYESAKIQVAAYRQLAIENGYPIQKVQILHINKKDGSFSEHNLSNDLLDNCWKAFLCCLELYQLHKVIK